MQAGGEASKEMGKADEETDEAAGRTGGRRPAERR